MPPILRRTQKLQHTKYTSAALGPDTDNTTQILKYDKFVQKNITVILMLLMTFVADLNIVE